MDRASSEEILLAVRRLRPRWQDLLGDEATTRAEELLASLDPDDAEDVRRTSNLLLQLFIQQEAIERLIEAIAEEGTAKDIELTSFSGGYQIGGERLSQPLPGGMTPIASTGITYRCPVPGCDYIWRPQAAGKRVPFCPHHPGHRLVKA